MAMNIDPAGNMMRSRMRRANPVGTFGGLGGLGNGWGGGRDRQPMTTPGGGGMLGAPQGGMFGGGGMPAQGMPMGGVQGMPMGGPSPLGAPMGMPSPMGGPMPTPAGSLGAPQTMQGGGPGGAPDIGNIMRKNGRVNIGNLSQMIAGQLPPDLFGQFKNGDPYSPQAQADAMLSAGRPYDPATGLGGATLSPQEQQAKAQLYAMHYAPDQLMASRMSPKQQEWMYGGGREAHQQFTDAGRSAADLARKQQLYFNQKGAGQPDDLDWSQFAGMRPRQALKNYQR